MADLLLKARLFYRFIGSHNARCASLGGCSALSRPNNAREDEQRLYALLRAQTPFTVAAVYGHQSRAVVLSGASAAPAVRRCFLAFAAVADC